MTASDTTVNGRSLIEQLWAAATTRNPADAVDVLAEDFVMEWPQSGERFHGFENALAAWEATEEKSTPAGDPRVIGVGDLWIVMAPVRYGTDPIHYVGVFELGEGKIRRATEYFAAPFEAPESRARYAEGD